MQTMHVTPDARVRLGATLAGFSLLVWIASLPRMHRLDEAVTRWLQRAAPLPDLPASILVRLGNAEFVIPAVAAVAGLIYLRNRRSGIAAIWLAAALVAASVLAVTLKHVIVHPGPPASLVRPGLPIGLYVATPYSFPSGHTLRVTVLAGTALRRSRWLGGALVLGMMLALVYTGGHWFSDVLGGLCLGWMVVEAWKVIRTVRSQSYRQG
jgi:membrane-associated phospholipid phosphatase